MSPTTDNDSGRDLVGLSDTLEARRYFAKFEGIVGHLFRVAATMQAEGRLSEDDVKVLTIYLSGIAASFRALATKYVMTGRDNGVFLGSLAIDRRESGFPMYQELLTMANDAQQAERHLRNMPSVDALKDAMLAEIIGELRLPTKTQYALSQRLYYEALQQGALFWARNDPEAIWQSTEGDRRHYLLHWAVYDSQINLPVIYLMDVEDSGRTALPKDQGRWPQAQAHLMAQSLGGLKLVTIAKGFDVDFDDLHPKRLRRLHVGPMYSSAFTSQSGPIRDVLKEAQAPKGDDWTLAWTMEDLESERVQDERKGWFGTVEREIFALDPFSGRGADTGATRTVRSIIIPQRPFQVLDDRQPPGFSNVRKFVVGDEGRVLSYR